MAAPRLLQNTRCLTRLSRNSSSSASPLKHRILHYLYTHFYDMEKIINWNVRLTHWNLHKKNAHYAYTEQLYGHYIAAAYFTLAQKGGVRFQGHEHWYRADKRGKFSWDFLQHKNLPVEGVDLSNSTVNYRGLDNIVLLQELRVLDLSMCPQLDDWAVSRLHVFKDCLEELSLAGCPRVTERGLATLHHLQNLRRLDVSGLPCVAAKG
ncbi:hypothetical protein FKM82_016157 [Ascaphus truei]